MRDASGHLYGCPASQRAGTFSMKSMPWLLDQTRKGLSSPALQLLCRGWENLHSKTLGLSWKNENILSCGKEGVSKQKPGIPEQKAESADNKQPELSCSTPLHPCVPLSLPRKRPPSKIKKSPVGSWRSFFNLGKSSSVSKRKLQRNPSEPSEMKAIALAGEALFQNPRFSAVQSDVSSGCLSPSSVQAMHDTSSSCSFPTELWSLLGLTCLCFAWNSFGKTRCGCCYNKSQVNSF